MYLVSIHYKLYIIVPINYFLKVLRFYAYFQEAIEEKQEERYRIRNCVILFYLEDDSIQVNEQAVENSGIPQGTCT